MNSFLLRTLQRYGGGLGELYTYVADALKLVANRGEDWGYWNDW